MTLTTRRLTLVACPVEAAQAILGSPPGGARLLGAAVPSGWLSPELEKTILLHLQELLHDPRALGWGVWFAIGRQDRAIVGEAGFKGRPDRDGTVEIGYGIAPPHRGRGYATEAVEALCRWSFTHPEVRRVVAECAPDNVASIRVLEKTGFRPIGGQAGFLYWENVGKRGSLPRSTQ